MISITVWSDACTGTPNNEAVGFDRPFLILQPMSNVMLNKPHALSPVRFDPMAEGREPTTVASNLDGPCPALSLNPFSHVISSSALLAFSEIWMVDFEFWTNADGLPDPVCLVAWELKSGRKIRLWHDEFGEAPPYPTDENVLFVAYYASAELGCHLALGWPLPERVLDLYAEFRNLTNGLPTVAGNGLLGALTYYGLDGIDAAEKDDMRRLILGGGPWSAQEREAILDYCRVRRRGTQ